jgi:hypothetical protein
VLLYLAVNWQVGSLQRAIDKENRRCRP